MRFAALLFAVAALAQDWPRFRGPNGSGLLDAANVPTVLARDKAVWRTPVPEGHSSPIWSGDRIWLTGHEGDQLITLCLNRHTGAILWKKSITRGRVEQRNPVNGPASSSPVTDGSNVFSFFPEFGFIAYDADGRERWRMPLGPFQSNNGFGSSPLLWKNSLILVVDQDTGSYLLSIDKDTGKVRWKRDRREVHGAGYTTPVIVNDTLIFQGSFELSAYQAETGEKLWWTSGLPYAPKASPVAGRDSQGRDLVFVNVQTVGEGGGRPELKGDLLAQYDTNKDGKLSREEVKPQRTLYGVFPQFDYNGDSFWDAAEIASMQGSSDITNILMAVRTGGRGDVTGSHVVWRYEKSVPEVPTPLILDGILYLLKEGGVFTAMKADTGEIVKQGRLAGALERYWASPIAAGGHIYCAGMDGHIVVVKPGANWEVAAVYDFGEAMTGTPAPAPGALYVRTKTALYGFKAEASAPASIH
jgi:outer membrane protein assembly factor BamB